MIEARDEYAELRGVMIRGRCEILEDEDTPKRVVLKDHRKLGGRY